MADSNSEDYLGIFIYILGHIFAAATNFIRIANLNSRNVQNEFTRDC